MLKLIVKIGRTSFSFSPSSSCTPRPLLLLNLGQIYKMATTSGPIPASSAPGGRQQRAFKTSDKPDEVRRSNLSAAKAVSDAVRTSLGPKGMDKMVSQQRGNWSSVAQSNGRQRRESELERRGMAKMSTIHLSLREMDFGML